MNRRIVTVACVVVVVFLSIWAFHRGSNSPPEIDLQSQPGLSRRSVPSAGGGDGSGVPNGRSATRREDTLKKYKLLWLELEEKNASTEERTELARKTAREFMFSDEMVAMVTFFEERKIGTGHPYFKSQLVLLFRSDLAHDARVSLLDNLDNLEEIRMARTLLENASTGLGEDDFRVFHKQVYDLIPKYSVAVLLGRNVRQMKTEPLKTLESVFSSWKSAEASEQSLKLTVSRMLDNISVSDRFDYEAMTQILSDHLTDDPKVWGQFQQKIYHKWAVVDADAAYAEWKNHDGRAYTLRELTEAAILKKSFEEANLWLSSHFAESENQAIAYTTAAEQWARTDAKEALFLANEIQDVDLRNDAIRRVDVVVREMNMRAEDR